MRSHAFSDSVPVLLNANCARANHGFKRLVIGAATTGSVPTRTRALRACVCTGASCAYPHWPVEPGERLVPRQPNVLLLLQSWWQTRAWRERAGD